MSVREVASAEFYELSRRTEGRLLVVQFTATWCGPCRRVSPQYEALARRTPDVEFVKVYEHNSREAIISSGVQSFPTFHFYCGGAKVDECRGANIQAVEQKAMQHKGSASAATGPVMVKLRFEREKARESGEGFVVVTEEIDLEVHASEGLEMFKFQVLSITDIDTSDQELATGDTNASIDSEASLVAALRRTGGGVYGNYPVIRVSKRAGGQAGAGQDGVPPQIATAVTGQGATGTPDWQECCSRTFFGKRPVIQPAYAIREESVLPQADLTNLQKKKAGPEAIIIVCKACAENCFVPGRAEHCPAISTNTAFVCQSKEACAKGYGSDLFSERADAGTEVLTPGSLGATTAEKEVSAAADLVYYNSRGHTGVGGENEEMQAMRQQISSRLSGSLAHEDAVKQGKARAILPPEGKGSMVERAAEMVAAGVFSKEEAMARALLSWFKKEFFTWTNKPPCSGCGGRGACMERKGGAIPTPDEAAAEASRVELYECKDCRVQTRFPRYNDPAKLLETRTGRCGEWSNCFTLICRAVGLEARCAFDWTDHVWTEIWIPAKNRWVHTDPCENKFDKPLMYEQGWNKRLSYIVAFDADGGVDVTHRYTRRWLQVLSRRNLAPEKWLESVLSRTGSSRSAARTALIATRLADEQRELKGYEAASCNEDQLDSEEKEGRKAGDTEWIAARGEDGGASAPAGTEDGNVSSTQTPSALIGAPLGVLHPGVGLTLCVAAVVERTGDASVLVGGATACQVSGRGRGGLCAAAVSASTGVLLDARAFLLRADSDSSTITAWLAELADGVVVAIAATGPTLSSAHLGAKLTEEICKLVGDASADSEGRPAFEGGDSTAWTLTGWKGTDRQQWSRRQHLSGGEHKRCALYAELLLPPRSLPTDQARDTSKSAYVELKDKLCRCPLRSMQYQAPALVETASLRGSASPVPATTMDPDMSLPARGTCYREGEPTVSIGPTVELVDSVGWTTVLQGPARGESADATGRDQVIFSAPVAWRLTSVSPTVGGWHDDTTGFDDGAVGCPAFVMGGSPVTLPDGTAFLPAGRVREIIAWSGDAVNGVQMVYDVGGVAVRGPKHMGEHGLYRQSSIVLDVEGGEVVTDISVRSGSIVDSLHVRTSKGREKKWGGDGGELQQTWRVPVGSSFLGFHGGVGGHIHCLGVNLEEQGDQTEGSADTNVRATAWPFLPEAVAANLYSADPVARACAQFLAFNATPATTGKGSDGGSSVTGSLEADVTPLFAAEVVTALETARKYADNLLGSPLDPRFSRIRLANGFFDRKLGRLPGGGGIIRAMGFELTDQEGRMHYVFRRHGEGGGLEGLRRARQRLNELVTTLKQSSA